MKIAILSLILCFSTLTSATSISYSIPGEISNITDHSWLVAIYTRSFLNLTASGAIISPFWVITMGHIVGNEYGPYFVRAGSDNAFNEGVTSEVHEVFHHPQCESLNKNKTLHDIAVLRLDTPIHENDMIKFVRLPTSDNYYEQSTTLRIIGWKLTNGIWDKMNIMKNFEIMKNFKLKEVYVRVSDFEGCQHSPLESCSLTDKKLCISKCCSFTSKLDISDNLGETGSPAVVNNTLYGLVAIASNQPTEQPIRLTKIADYVNWIYHLMAYDPLLYSPFGDKRFEFFK